MVEQAQQEARNYWFTYNRRIKVEDVTQALANVALAFGDDDAKAAMSRPFGVAIMFAGCDIDGVHLYVGGFVCVCVDIVAIYWKLIFLNNFAIKQ
jgi:20S proteasome subunit alpha 5